jgi:hypothetical protein
MSEWITVKCEKAFYIDFGNAVVACDRLPSNPTLILKLSSEQAEKLGDREKWVCRDPQCEHGCNS